MSGVWAPGGGRVLQVGGDEAAGDPLGRRKPELVLEQLVVEQALLLAVEAEEPKRLLAAERDHELGREVELFPAVVGQHGHRVGAGIEGIGRRWGADGIRVHPPRRVHHAKEGDAGEERPVGLEDESVEAEVGVAGEEAIGLVGRLSMPSRPAVHRDDVHHAGQRLPVACGEGVGGQGGLGDHAGRDPHAERIGGGVELILDPHAVEDERSAGRGGRPGSFARLRRPRGRSPRRGCSRAAGGVPPR